VAVIELRFQRFNFGRTDKHGKLLQCELRLSWRDGDLDRSVRSEIVAIRSMMLGIPMPNASLDLTQEVEAALIG
jgi:hypothetical protein